MDVVEKDDRFLSQSWSINTLAATFHFAHENGLGRSGSKELRCVDDKNLVRGLIQLVPQIIGHLENSTKIYLMTASTLRISSNNSK